GSQLERQFGLSAGALIVPINTLKRNLCIEQDGPWYRLTTIGQDALSRPERSARKPFADRQGW
ncbi:hypothetical protein KKH23_04200, partial [Patescibacteria group bacterium]|nr:hypothetical protein [Patescibacteria group bacterium]